MGTSGAIGAGGFGRGGESRWSKKSQNLRPCQPTAVRNPYLRFLDPVLRLAALAVHAVVQRLGITGKVCHDEARVAALRTPFKPRDHAPLVRPALCGVVEFIDHALFGPAALVFVFH